MKAAHNQSPAQRQALLAQFNAHPQVVSLHDAIAAHAEAHGLRFDAAGMSEVSAFAAAWQAAHGPVPNSGLAIG